MFKKVFNAMVEARRHQVDKMILHAMSDRDLNDIGINRSDINRMVDGK